MSQDPRGHPLVLVLLLSMAEAATPQQSMIDSLSNGGGSPFLFLKKKVEFSNLRYLNLNFQYSTFALGIHPHYPPTRLVNVPGLALPSCSPAPPIRIHA
jgi:hypothetical protein